MKVKRVTALPTSDLICLLPKFLFLYSLSLSTFSQYISLSSSCISLLKLYLLLSQSFSQLSSSLTLLLSHSLNLSFSFCLALRRAANRSESIVSSSRLSSINFLLRDESTDYKKEFQFLFLKLATRQDKVNEGYIRKERLVFFFLQRTRYFAQITNPISYTTDHCIVERIIHTKYLLSGPVVDVIKKFCRKFIFHKNWEIEKSLFWCLNLHYLKCTNKCYFQAKLFSKTVHYF